MTKTTSEQQKLSLNISMQFRAIETKFKYINAVPMVKTKEGDAMPNINLNFPKPNKVFNKQIFDNLFDYSHFIEVWY